MWLVYQDLDSTDPSYVSNTAVIGGNATQSVPITLAPDATLLFENTQMDPGLS